jgi:hypothetical protein
MCLTRACLFLSLQLGLSDGAGLVCDPSWSLLISNIVKDATANLKADSSLAVDMQAFTAFTVELIDERP